MPSVHWKTIFATALCAAANPQHVLAQVAAPTIVAIDLENYVTYVGDTSDVTKFGMNPNATPAKATTFESGIAVADIVAINGQPAKGTFVFRGTNIALTPTPSPGQAIADTDRTGPSEVTFEILKEDSTPIGTIMCFGQGGGPSPPGAPLSVTVGNYTVIGGTGAFLGARGYMGRSALRVPPRLASVSEDPANRRINGGGKFQYVVHLIPLEVPQIVSAAQGPAVFHLDYSPVTPAKPARAGEILILIASGLGPTRPGVEPGQPFTSDPPPVVNSPIQVLVNGKSGDVLYAGGYPGAVDIYQVNFRVPDDTAAEQTSIRLTAAWISGPVVNIPTQ